MLLCSAAVFLGSHRIEALASGEYQDNSLQSNIGSSEDNKISENGKFTEGQDNSEYPDLGDDQVFPFVAGLDSYESRN